MGQPQDPTYGKKIPRTKHIRKIGATRESPNPKCCTRKNSTYRPLRPKRNRRGRNSNDDERKSRKNPEGKMGSIPTGGKDTDREYKLQGYTERLYGRPCSLYPTVPLLVATYWKGPVWRLRRRSERPGAGKGIGDVARCGGKDIKIATKLRKK